MCTRPAGFAVSALATLALAFLPRESVAYPTVEGQPAKYVIITGDALVASFQPLADWKTQTGLPAVVRSMSQVIAAHPAAFDDAERVRLEIREAWQAGAEWVLLGGGAGVVPVRYAHTTFFGGKDLLTDLYFQCLEGNWDADGDHVYGEGFLSALDPGDNADLTPDVWLGRAPVQTAAEADRFVAKTLQYERTPAGDYEHRSLECAEVLFPQNWTPGDPVLLDGADLVEPLLSFFDLHPSLQVTRLYENFSNPAWRPGAFPETRAAVLDSMRVGTNQTLIVGTGGIHDVSVGPGTIGESDFLALTNGSRLQSLRFLGSSAAQFDSGGLARAALLAPGGGAASVIGASDFTFPTAARFEMTEYYRLTYQDGVNAQGEASARSILPFLPFTNFDGVHRWTVMTQLLLGDPEMRVWTGPLRELEVRHKRPPFVGDASFDVTVSSGAQPEPGARVVAWFPGEFLGVAITDANGVASVPIHPTRHGKLTLTVTALNARPFQQTLPVAGPTLPRNAWLAGTRIAAPPSLGVRVLGARPVVGSPEVELTLGTGAPARVEVLDVAGRRIESRDLAGLGAGPHTLRLGASEALAPGLYWLRLTQDGREARARMLVLR